MRCVRVTDYTGGLHNYLGRYVTFIIRDGVLIIQNGDGNLAAFSLWRKVDIIEEPPGIVTGKHLMRM